jgi:hypothetical protein
MPTQQHTRLLIVEGESDRSFFEALLRRLKLDVAIHVVVPRDLSATPNDPTRNTKQGVIKRLDSQVRRLATGHLLALGVVIDADQPTQGGFEATRTLVAKALALHGFDAPVSSGQGGLLATHPDGLPPVGLWVMPDNIHPGTLEDWIIRCRHPGETTLWQHAQQAIDTLPGGPRFNPTTRRAKADVATWLAWQAAPGEERYTLVNSLSGNQPLLDETAPLFRDLCNWLRQVFSSDSPEAP